MRFKTDSYNRSITNRSKNETTFTQILIVTIGLCNNIF